MKLAAALTVILALAGCHPNRYDLQNIDPVSGVINHQQSWNDAAFAAQQQVNMMNSNPARFGGR